VPDLSKGQALACIVLVIAVLAPTTFVLYEKTLPTPQSLFGEGVVAFDNGNFGTASDLFYRSYHGYLEAGERDKAIQSLNMKFRADRVFLDYSLTREQAFQTLTAAFGEWVSAEDIEHWLNGLTSEMIISDGKEYYYGDIAANMAFRNLTLYGKWKGENYGQDVKDMMVEVMSADAKRTGIFFNPVNYVSNATLILDRKDLPASGSVLLWIPAPIGTASQTGVAFLSAQPEEYVKSSSSPGSDLGEVYLEIPLEGLTNDIVVNVYYSTTSYQKHFDIDPSHVGSYDRNSIEYAKYTASTENILLTPEILAEAKAVVGDETNPFLQAKLLYNYVTGNITYSFLPHGFLAAKGVSVSEDVRINRFGDCGAQSMYYCALLRSLGVPARTDGGYQTFHNGTGTHFWAEFLLPNYGWVPVDVTASDMMDWISPDVITPQERAAYKAYFFGNLDNMRYVIQNDADIVLTPLPSMDRITNAVFQKPVAICASSDQDVAILAVIGFSLVINKTG
jgi:hypothetical protein